MSNLFAERVPNVSFDPEQEWIIAVCGLLAHADGVLTTGEIDHMVGLLDEHIAPDERARWVQLLADHEALMRHFAGLQPPLPAFAEPLLEKAWTMVLVDGAPGEAELRVLEGIAGDIGVEREELAEWRSRWSARLSGFAEHIAEFAAVLIHHDGQLDPAEAEQFSRLVSGLPLSPERRDELIATHLSAAPAIGDMGARIATLSRGRRLTVLRALAPLVAASSRADLGRQFFLGLADKAAIPAEQAEALLVSA